MVKAIELVALIGVMLAGFMLLKQKQRPQMPQTPSTPTIVMPTQIPSIQFPEIRFPKIEAPAMPSIEIEIPQQIQKQFKTMQEKIPKLPSIQEITKPITTKVPEFDLETQARKAGEKLGRIVVASGTGFAKPFVKTPGGRTLTGAGLGAIMGGPIGAIAGVIGAHTVTPLLETIFGR